MQALVCRMSSRKEKGSSQPRGEDFRYDKVSSNLLHTRRNPANQKPIGVSPDTVEFRIGFCTATGVSGYLRQKDLWDSNLYLLSIVLDFLVLPVVIW